MISKTDLQRRDIPVTMNGLDFLTSRTSKSTEGDTQHTYIGYAYPGTKEGERGWMIQRISEFADESSATLFVNGNAQFNQIWADRETLVYL